MTDKTAAEKHSLTVRRTIQAPRRRVFSAWTNPDEIQRWHASDAYSTLIKEFDLRKGGAYRFEFTHRDTGKLTPVWGTFLEVEAPERLVYSWNHDGPEFSFTDSVVTVQFYETGDKTEVVVNHDFFPTTESRDAHQGGWTDCLGRIAEIV